MTYSWVEYQCRTWFRNRESQQRTGSIIGVRTMSRTNYRNLIDRGRKAGLGTAELYRAMAARRPEADDQNLRQSDSNGFVTGVGGDGRRVYLPLMGRPNG